MRGREGDKRVVRIREGEREGGGGRETRGLSGYGKVRGREEGSQHTALDHAGLYILDLEHSFASRVLEEYSSRPCKSVLLPCTMCILIDVAGDAKGRHVVIVDDLVQTGGTLIQCAKV